jgi:hypothetical protein
MAVTTRRDVNAIRELQGEQFLVSKRRDQFRSLKSLRRGLHERMSQGQTAIGAGSCWLCSCLGTENHTRPIASRNDPVHLSTALRFLEPRWGGAP